VAQPPVDRAREAAAEQVERARLTFRRLAGLDRSGPPPPQTLPGAPWHVWTLPNGIGLIRLALIPLFLALGVSSDTGTDPFPAILFATIAWADYADGIAARVTGQYSRFGALLDPVVDRLLVVSGVVVCWHFNLLPRWALALLAARELLMLVLARIALSRGVDLKINWLGRWGVWPVFGALFFAICGVHWLALACLYVGLVLAIGASVLYVRDGLRAASGQGST
jgi:phosphatidylglycerophosphate synthase